MVFAISAVVSGNNNPGCRCSTAEQCAQQAHDAQSCPGKTAGNYQHPYLVIYKGQSKTQFNSNYKSVFFTYIVKISYGIQVQNEK